MLKPYKVVENYIPDILYLRHGDEVQVGMSLNRKLLLFEDIDKESLSNLPKELIVDYNDSLGFLDARIVKVKTPYSIAQFLKSKGVKTITEPVKIKNSPIATVANAVHNLQIDSERAVEVQAHPEEVHKNAPAVPDPAEQKKNTGFFFGIVLSALALSLVSYFLWKRRTQDLSK